MRCPKEGLHNDSNSEYANRDHRNFVMSHPLSKSCRQTLILREGKSGFFNPLSTHRLSKTKQTAFKHMSTPPILNVLRKLCVNLKSVYEFEWTGGEESDEKGM